MEDQGAFLSILRAAGRPGQAVKNVLGGRMGSAGRQLAQLGIDAVDAFLPGDWLPNDVATEADDLSGADLVGAGDGFVGGAVGFGVDVLTDPLTYIPGGVFAKGAKAAGGALRSGAAKVVGEEALDAAGRHVRSTFGHQAISDASRVLRDSATADGNLVSQAQARAFADSVKGLTEEERKLAFRTVNNYTRDAAGRAVPIVADDAPQLATAAEQSMAQSLVPGVEAGRQVDPLRAGEAMTTVKDWGLSRGPINAIDRGVGIKGVADPLAYDLLSDGAKDQFTGLNVFNKHEPFQELAADTLDTAYPVRPTEPRFSSGNDLANQALLNPGGGGDAIRSLRPDMPLGPTGEINVARAGRNAAVKSAQGIDDVSEAMIGAPAKVAPEAVAESTRATFDTIEGHAARYANRINALPIPDAQKAKLITFFDQWLPLVQEQYAQSIDAGAFHRIPGVDIRRQMPVDYVHRRFSGLTDEAGDVLGGGASASKERTLRTGENLRDFLNNPANAGVTLEEDIGKASIYRAAQSGKMTQGAKTAAGLLDDVAAKTRAKQAEAMKTGSQATLTETETKALEASGKALNEDGVSATVKNVLDEMEKAGAKEDAQVLRDSIFGLPPRGGLASLLAKSNSVFKPAATVGYALPHISFNVRNRVSGIWQTYSNPGTRAETGNMAKRFFSDLIGAVGDGLGLQAKDRLGQVVAQWDAALGQAGGSADRALAIMAKSDPQAAAFIKAGGVDGFVRSEDMISELTATGKWAKLHQKMKWPAKIGKGIEDRMRMGLGLDLMAKGKSAEEAARLVKETLFDYTVSSASNRAYRDVIPFGAYTSQAIPQQARLLAEKPWLASTISHAIDGDGNDPVMPYMEGRVNIGLGDNQFISGLGLPFEALNSIPNPSASVADFGHQVLKNVVGASQPLAKTALSAVFDRDPFFGTEYGSYDKAPIVGHAGDAGRLYNQVAGTGLISPLDSSLRQVDHLLDDRKPLAYRAIDALSGLNFVTVDPEKARQAQLMDALANNPDVLQMQTPVNVSGDPEVQALIDELRAVKASLRKKKAAGG